MASLYDKYRIKRGDDIGNPEFWNARLKSIDARLAKQESIEADLNSVIEEARTAFRDRADDYLIPLIQEISEIAHLGVMLRATSETQLSVATGGKTLVIDEGMRNRYAAPSYVAIYRTSSPWATMLGWVQSYDPETGELVVDIDEVDGSGAHGGWTIAVASPLDMAETFAQTIAAKAAAENSAEQAQQAAVTAVQQAGAVSDMAAQVSADSIETEAAKDATQAAVASMSQVYLGAHAQDPVTDLNGNAIEEGADYWNTTDGVKKTYYNGGFTVAYVPVGSEVTTIFGRTGNVVAQSGDYSADKISAAISGVVGNTVKAAIEEILTALTGKAAAGHDHAISEIPGLQGALDAKAADNHGHSYSQLSGKPVTLAQLGVTDLYSKAEVDAAIAAVVGGAPELLNTFEEFSNALGDDPNFAATIGTQMGSKLNALLLSTFTLALIGKTDASAWRLALGLGSAAVKADNYFATAQALADLIAQVALKTTKINTGAGLTGGGDLSANRTFALEIHSKTEAENGTGNDKAMSAQRTKEAITKQTEGKAPLNSPAFTGTPTIEGDDVVHAGNIAEKAEAAGVGGGLIAVVADRRPQGQSYGDVVIHSWRTKEINTVDFDGDDLISLAADIVTVKKAGTYKISVLNSGSYRPAGAYRARLVKNGSSVLEIGLSVKAVTTTDALYAETQGPHILWAGTLAANDQITCEYWVDDDDGGARTIGNASGDGTECYLLMTIEKVK